MVNLQIEDDFLWKSINFFFQKKKRSLLLMYCDSHNLLRMTSLPFFLCFHTTFIQVVHITVEIVLRLFVKYLLFYFVSYNDSFLIMLMFKIVVSC